MNNNFVLVSNENENQSYHPSPRVNYALVLARISTRLTEKFKKIPFYVLIQSFEHQLLLLHRHHHYHCSIMQPRLRSDVPAENVIRKLI